MEEIIKNTICIMTWEQLQKRERNSKEELLLQSICRLEPAYWTGVKVIEDYLYGAFCLHEGKNAEKRIVSAAFLLNEQEFLLVILKDEEGILRQMEETQQPEGSQQMEGSQQPRRRQETEEESEGLKMEEGLERLFDGILERGQQKVEKMEKYLIAMEQEIVSGRLHRNRNQAIFECKRALTVWKNDYAQFLNIVEGINGLEQKKKENQGQILTEESACYFRIYENKLKHLIEETQFLYEELVHIREALDAALSYEQNRIMKVFTTVTTIFMPLTLIAGWYGMNFIWMPELHWRYGYVFVGVLSVLVVLVCIWFFKKKKLF